MQPESTSRNAAASASAPPAGATRQPGIDAVRLLAFLGVVLIHAYDMGGPIAFWAAAWGRFAVPTFFIVAGFFLKTDLPLGTIATRSARRLLPIFLFWAGLYLIVYQAWPHSPRDWALLLIKGGRGNHLWFIPSLLLCIVGAAALIRSLGLVGAAAIGLLLYTAGLAIGSYAPLLGVHQSVWNPRDGIAFGLLFVVIGCTLRAHPVAIGLRGALLLFACCSILHVAEFAAVSRFGPEYTDFFLTTPALATSAFLLARAWQPAGPGAVALANLGRYSLGYYAVHMFFINLCKAALPQGVAGWLATVVVVLLSSIAATLIIAQVRPLQRLVR